MSASTLPGTALAGTLTTRRALCALAGVAAVLMRSGSIRSKPLLLTISLVLAVVLGTAHAQAGAVPAPVQAAIVQKIFAYDKTLAGVRNHRVLIIDASGASADLIRAFTGVGFNVQVVSPQKLDASGDISAIYVLGSVVPAEVASAAESRKILTIAGDETLAEGGKVSVALGVVSGKPQIVVHLGRLTAEGHKFSAELLALAKVVR